MLNGVACTTGAIRGTPSACIQRVGTIDCADSCDLIPLYVGDASEALVAAHEEHLRELTDEVSHKRIVLDELDKFVAADGALRRALTLTDGRLNSRARGTRIAREEEAIDRNKYEKYDARVGALFRLPRAIANHPPSPLEAVKAVARMELWNHDSICDLRHPRSPVCRGF